MLLGGEGVLCFCSDVVPDRGVEVFPGEKAGSRTLGGVQGLRVVFNSSPVSENYVVQAALDACRRSM